MPAAISRLPLGAHGQQVVAEPAEHDGEQRGDRELEPAVAALFEREDPERDHRRHQPGHGQRHVEQQVQPDRGPDELGQVGRHRDQLRLHPQAQADRPPQMGPA
jgi:hypothetical protein